MEEIKDWEGREGWYKGREGGSGELGRGSGVNEGIEGKGRESKGMDGKGRKGSVGLGSGVFRGGPRGPPPQSPIAQEIFDLFKYE